MFRYSGVEVRFRDVAAAIAVAVVCYALLWLVLAVG